MRHAGRTAQASGRVLAVRDRCRSGWLVRAATCVVVVLGSAIAIGSQASATGTTGSISGTVTAAAGGGDVSGICVDALTSDGTLTLVGSATTAADGTYAISGLSAGNYDVEFSVAGCGTTGSYLTQWYNNATTSSTAHVVPVTAGATTASINAALISGAITGDGDGSNWWGRPGRDLRGRAANRRRWVWVGHDTGRRNVHRDRPEIRELQRRVLYGLWEQRELPHTVVQRSGYRDFGGSGVGGQRSDHADASTRRSSPEARSPAP